MKIELGDNATQDAIDAIEAGLVEHARERGIEPRQHRPLALVMRDESGAIVGGLVAATVWGWLHVKDLWVAAHLGGLGWGAQLLDRAEREAVRRGCHHAMLDTFDFQALGFYEQLGYAVFGELNDFPTGHVRHFVSKSLDRMATD